MQVNKGSCEVKESLFRHLPNGSKETLPSFRLNFPDRRIIRRANEFIKLNADMLLMGSFGFEYLDFSIV